MKKNIQEFAKIWKYPWTYRILIFFLIVQAFCIFIYIENQSIKPSLYRDYSGVLVNTTIDKETFLEAELQREEPVYYSTKLEENLFLNEIVKEFRRTEKRKEYIEKLQKSFENQLSFLEVTETTTSEFQNLKKAQKDFAGAIGISACFLASRGLFEVLSFYPTVIFCVIIACYLVTVVCILDRDSGMDMLFQTTARGYKNIQVRKSLAIFGSLSLIVIIMYLESYLIFGYAYGYISIDNFGNTVQSVYGLENVTMRTSISVYLLLSLIQIIFNVFFWGCLLGFFDYLVKNTTWAYIIMGLLVGAEWCLYSVITPQSHLILLRQINLISATNPTELFINYQNISFPFGAFSYKLFFFVIFLLIYVWIMWRWMHYKSTNTSEIKRSFMVKKIRGLRPCTVFLAETYKGLIKTGILCLIVLGIFGTYYFGKCNDEHIPDLESLYYKQFMVQIEGPITEEKKEWLAKKITSLKMDAGDEKEKIKALEKLNNDIDQLPMGAYIVYPKGYMTQYAYPMDNLLRAMVATSFIVFALSFFWAIDYSSGVFILQEVYAVGKDEINKKKRILSVGICIISFLLVYGVWYITAKREYLFTMLSAPACSLKEMSWVRPEISIGCMLFIISVIRLLYCIGLSFLVAWTAKRYQKVSLTVLYSILLTVPFLFIIYL